MWPRWSAWTPQLNALDSEVERRRGWALERYSDNASVAEAHLRLARLLVAKGMPVAARIERNKAVGRLDVGDQRRGGGCRS